MQVQAHTMNERAKRMRSYVKQRLLTLYTDTQVCLELSKRQTSQSESLLINNTGSFCADMEVTYTRRALETIYFKCIPNASICVCCMYFQTESESRSLVLNICTNFSDLLKRCNEISEKSLTNICTIKLKIKIQCLMS